MKANIAKQFEQFFRMFERVVEDYDDRSWNQSGHGITVPTNLSFHILQSIKYYSYNTAGFARVGCEELSHDYKAMERMVVAQADILANIRSLKPQLLAWIDSIDLDAENPDFKWTGCDMESVVIFIIRHSYFHLGELNALLNEQKNGEAEDHFANNIY
jgi:hypothetical protein